MRVAALDADDDRWQRATPVTKFAIAKTALNALVVRGIRAERTKDGGDRAVGHSPLHA